MRVKLRYLNQAFYWILHTVMDRRDSFSKIRSRSATRSSNTAGSDFFQTKSELTPVVDPEPYLKGDRGNIVILLFLYLLQGIPLGLSSAIPIILQDRHISYDDQDIFFWLDKMEEARRMGGEIRISDTEYLYALCTLFCTSVQYECALKILGIGMLLISRYADDWIGDEKGVHKPNIKFLTLAFFFTNFLAATQDIAVDGWALTMLQRKNVGHASTCNTVGQTAGFFLGYVVFVALVSPEFCNKWLRTAPQPVGVITFSEFVQFWGVVFIICTTLLAIFKSDKCPYAATEDGSPHLNIKQSYELLVDIFKLQTIKLMAVLLLTCKIGFAACDAVSPLKLIEAGISKEKIALTAVPLIPLQIILPFVISKYIVGPRPLDVFMNVIPYRLLIGLVAALLVFVTPYIVTKDNIPVYYYVLLLIVYGLHQMMLYCMFVSCMAFYAKVSDPRSGGTYMTLLNTLTNMGTVWPATVSLWLVDKLTWKKCVNSTKCSGPNCVTEEICTTTLDGFYIEIISCTIIGILWLRWARTKMDKLQNLDESAWKVHSRLVGDLS